MTTYRIRNPDKTFANLHRVCTKLTAAYKENGGERLLPRGFYIDELKKAIELYEADEALCRWEHEQEKQKEKNYWTSKNNP